jgi:hypothetical protein
VHLEGWIEQIFDAMFERDAPCSGVRLAGDLAY